jgi:hypothetical protein
VDRTEQQLYLGKKIDQVLAEIKNAASSQTLAGWRNVTSRRQKTNLGAINQRSSAGIVLDLLKDMSNTNR